MHDFVVGGGGGGVWCCFDQRSYTFKNKSTQQIYGVGQQHSMNSIFFSVTFAMHTHTHTRTSPCHTVQYANYYDRYY